MKQQPKLDGQNQCWAF